MVLSTSRARDKTEVEGSHSCAVSTFKLFEGQEKLPQKVDEVTHLACFPTSFVQIHAKCTGSNVAIEDFEERYLP